MELRLPQLCRRAQRFAQSHSAHANPNRRGRKSRVFAAHALGSNQRFAGSAFADCFNSRARAIRSHAFHADLRHFPHKRRCRFRRRTLTHARVPGIPDPFDSFRPPHSRRRKFYFPGVGPRHAAGAMVSAAPSLRIHADTRSASGRGASLVGSHRRHRRGVSGLRQRAPA